MENQTTPPAPSNAGQTMGIVALVLGILALPLSFIPCVGWLALPPACLGIIFGIVGLVQAKNNNGKSGLATAGLVISVISLIAVGYMTFMVTKLAKEGANELMNDSTFMLEMDSLRQQMDTVKMDTTVMK